MALSLALVTSSDDEHGRTVHGAESQCCDGNTCSGGLLLGGLVATIAGAESIVAVIVTIATVAAFTATIGAAIVEIAADGNFPFNEFRQIANNRVGVMVEGRVG